MKTNDIKKNSHTQRTAATYHDRMVYLCEKMQVSKDDWTAALFEYGMLYLWNNYSYEEARKIASSVHTYFWEYWMQEWMESDAHILSIVGSATYSWERYLAVKIHLTKKVHEKVQSKDVEASAGVAE